MVEGSSMRWKWFVAVVALIIVFVTAAVYFYLYTYNYNRLKPLIAQTVEDATGRKLHLGGDIDLKFGLRPELVVTDVALANASWGSQPQMLEIETLQARVRLLPLLIKRVDVQLFRLDGVRMLLETGPNSEANWRLLTDDDPSHSPSWAFKPTAIEIDHLKIENLHFTSRGTGTGPSTQLTIARLEMSRQGSEDKLTLTLSADYNGQPATLSGKIGPVGALLGHRRFPLQLAGNLADVAVNANGSIYDVLQLQGIDVNARFSGKNVATLGPVLPVQLPETEAFDVAGKLKGSRESLGLNIDGNLSGSSINLAVNGSVDNLIDLSGMDLNLKSSGKNLAVLRPILGEGIPSTREFEVQGRLTGSAHALKLSDARAAARRGSLDFTASGSVKDLIAFEGMDLQSRLIGRNFAELGEVIDVELPATDEFDIQGRLTGSGDVMPLHDVKARGRRGNLNIYITGSVQDLSTLEGMNLQSRVTGKNLVEFGEVIRVELPATDEFEIEGSLTGSTEALPLHKARGSARRGSLQLVLTGKVEDLITLGGMDLQTHLTGRNLAEFGEVIEIELPATDNFDIQGHLVGSTEALAVYKARGSARRGTMELFLTGAVQDLLTLGGMNLQPRLSGKELAEIGPLLDTEIPGLGPFNVGCKLTGSAKAIALSEVSALVDKSDFAGRAEIDLRGRPKVTARLASSMVDFTTLMDSVEQKEQKKTR